MIKSIRTRRAGLLSSGVENTWRVLPEDNPFICQLFAQVQHYIAASFADLWTPLIRLYCVSRHQLGDWRLLIFGFVQITGSSPSLLFRACDRRLFSYPLINGSARCQRGRYLFSSHLAGRRIPPHCVAAQFWNRWQDSGWGGGGIC
jgi:hypothetical protein